MAGLIDSLRRSTRRAWLQRVGLAAMPAWIAGCTSGRQGKERTLRFWAMGREAEVVGELIPDFVRERPGLTVRVEQLPFTAAHEKLLTAFAGDATPDIAQLGNTWVPELAALHALEPLQKMLDADPAIAPADYFDGIWRTNLVDGVLYGVPWYVDTRLLFYRRDLFAKAGVARVPDTWAGFSAALDALQKSGIAHPIYLPLNEFEPLLALSLQHEAPLLREGGRFGNFRGESFTQGLAYYVERFRRGHAPLLSSFQIANLHQEFGRATFAAFISGPWNIGELDRRLEPGLRNAWSTAPLPGPNGPGASTAGGSSLVVFRRSALKGDAMALLAYLSRPATQLRFHALTGDLPPRRSAWAMRVAGAPPLSEEPRAIAFAQQLERVRPSPEVPEWERIVQEMQLLATRAVQLGASVEATAATLDQRVDGFLEKRRWMLAQASAGAAR